MYTYPFQEYSYVRDNNPRNIIELLPDSDDGSFYNLRPELSIRKSPFIFTPSHIKTTIRPNTFTDRNAGKYSNVDLTNFETEYFSQNIQIPLFNYLERTLVILSFLLILQKFQIPTFLRLTLTVHFVLDYKINSLM